MLKEVAGGVPAYAVGSQYSLLSPISWLMITVIC